MFVTHIVKVSLLNAELHKDLCAELHNPHENQLVLVHKWSSLQKQLDIPNQYLKNNSGKNKTTNKTKKMGKRENN